MAQRAQVLETLYRAIDEINQGRTENLRISKTEATDLAGGDTALDSLGLVNLIVAIEEQILEVFNASINIADEKARTRTPSPFATVGTLADYVTGLLEGQKDG